MGSASQAVELKIPPPVVAALVAGAMWGLSLTVPSLAVPVAIRVVAAATIALIGGIVSVCGVISFRRASTTINPTKPETASSLVTTGIFRFTRNPMYLGLLFVLLAWAVFLTSAWVFVGPVVFVLYINRFQIEPEERALSAKFGAAYSAYRRKVRRWL